MLDISLLPVFLLGAIALSLTPGPDMAFTLATSLANGRRAGLFAALGICTGSMLWALAAAAGVVALIAASDMALTLLRWAGGAYLIYLAYRSFRKLGDLPKAEAAGSALIAFIKGMTTNLLNPKVGLFYLAFLPAFTNPELGPVSIQILELAALFTLSGFIVLITTALLAHAIRQKVMASRRWRIALNGLAGSVFALLGLRLLVSRI